GGFGAGDGLFGFLAAQLGHRHNGFARGRVVDGDGGAAAGAHPFAVDVAGVAQQLGALERLGQLRHEDSLIYESAKWPTGRARPAVGARGRISWRNRRGQAVRTSARMSSAWAN